ncbi:MAG: site-specific DNA-methyltransferase [Phycisphaerae bacterium]|nr:site-specific DNA-methyltransferase [Phycisphaerae bacterium]
MDHNTIYCGDAIQLLNSWPIGGVDLVFADPPFNIGYVYDKYKDDVPNGEYVKWSREWMAACRRVLKRDGSFYIAIGDDFAADIRILGRQLGLHLRNWIIWHYTFGQNARAKFSRAHTHIFYFTKDARRFTFNDRQLRFPSARHTEYQDLRANPLGRLPNDVWDEFPRVCGTFKERAGFHGCQMPEALLMRIVQASSNPGDVVLDPFVGSGTTAVAAKRLGRRYVGIDISQTYAEHTKQRLATIHDESGAQPRDGEWPALHVDMLMQLYRETKVTLANLLPNEVALGVIAASLSERTGAGYEVADVKAQFERLAQSNGLPKLPNDTEFVARNHVTTEGKRYRRQVKRVQKRRTDGETAAGNILRLG